MDFSTELKYVWILSSSSICTHFRIQMDVIEMKQKQQQDDNEYIFAE